MINAVDSISTYPQCGVLGNPYNMEYLDYGYGMNNSIFSAPIPMTGGMNNQNFYDYAMNNLQWQQNYNIQQQNGQRNVDLRVNGSVEAVKGAAQILKDKILTNEQDQIDYAYNNFLETVRLAYGNASETELKARAATLYAQMNGGKSIYQDLRENSHGSFTQGAIQAMTFGLYDRNSAEDNISRITGAPVGTTDKLVQNTGRVAGSAAIGAAVGGLAKAFKVPKAGWVGLAAATIAGIMSFATGKVTT